jgi:sialate O-acetylesterase
MARLLQQLQQQQQQLQQLFVLLVTAAAFFDIAAAAAAGTPCLANFSANYGSTMVLQRAPAQASIYGFANGAAAVSITLSGSDHLSRGVASTIHSAAVHDGAWKVMLPPKMAGGSYQIALSCGSSSSTTKRDGERSDGDVMVPAVVPPLEDVTFGDVWYCSGQSNMELSLKFTFERNKTVADILAGKYQTIRAYLNPHVTSPTPVFVSPGSPASAHDTIFAGASSNMEWTWNKLATVVNGSDVQGSPLMAFSAACLYFGIGLTERMEKASYKSRAATSDQQAEGVIPLGMMGVSWGGTLIEQWTPIERQAACTNISCLGCVKENSTNGCHFSPQSASQCTGNGALYNGMVAPFVNMSVKGFIFYQGVD